MFTTNWLKNTCDLKYAALGNNSNSFRRSGGRCHQAFFNWDSLHARLNSHYKAWSYKKKKHKKIKAYRMSVEKESTVKRYLLILDLKAV